jgi:exopolysaccharide biosynthesis polyprenyl glycosylphosphotransferase
MAVAFLLRFDLSRGWLILTFVLSLTFVTAERFAVRAVFSRVRRQGLLLRPVVVVGGNHEGVELCTMLRNDAGLGYEVRGFVDDDQAGHPNANLGYHPILGTLEETIDAVRKTGSTGVIIAATAMDLGTSNRLIRELTDAGIHVELSSTLRDIAAHRLTVRPLGRFPVVYIEPVARHGWRQTAKRVFDVVMAGTILVLTAPIFGLAALAVKLDSKGPVLFRQTRVGRDGHPFECLKLRSMVVDAEARLADLKGQNEADGPLFKMHDDPRVTRVGKIIRKLSIDELPQLVNVLRNEMSMVGPRPALPSEVDAWGPDLHGRLRVQPGITGMWQVSGRSDASFESYERLDLYYVDNWSLATDLAIVAKTIPSVLLRRGAF